MPRYGRIVGQRPRLQIEGGIYHVTSRGNRRQAIFEDRDGYALFLELLSRVVEIRAWRCHAYCLMPNHFHLIVETPAANLSAGMHQLKSGYVRWFNRRHAVEGHLFERRFWSVLVRGNAHLLELSRYVVLNPVRARLCPHPGEWSWSSYRDMVGVGPSADFLTRDWLLEQFGATPERARRAYAAFVAAGIEPIRSAVRATSRCLAPRRGWTRRRRRPLGHVPVPGTGTWLDQPKP